MKFYDNNGGIHDKKIGAIGATIKNDINKFLNNKVKGHKETNELVEMTNEVFTMPIEENVVEEESMEESSEDDITDISIEDNIEKIIHVEKPEIDVPEESDAGGETTDDSITETDFRELDLSIGNNDKISIPNKSNDKVKYNNKYKIIIDREHKCLLLENENGDVVDCTLINERLEPLSLSELLSSVYEFQEDETHEGE